MKEFSYSLFYRLLYRYGNIPVTIILFIYLLVFSAAIQKSYYFIILLLVTAYLLYKINRLFLELYKILPFRITLTDEEIICSGFFFRNEKKIIIRFEDIGGLEGGIFQKKYSGLMKIYDARFNRYIGFYHQLNNARILEAILLNKVPGEVYEKVSRKMGLAEKPE